MSDQAAEATDSVTPIDVPAVLSDKGVEISAILEARDACIQVKDARRAAQALNTELPRTLDAAKSDADAIRTKGLTLFVLGRNRQAADWLAKAGRTPVVRHVLGLAQLHGGRYPDAIATLDPLAAPETSVRPALAEACLRAGDLAGARKMIGKLVKADRESADGTFLVGYLAELSGEYDDAYGRYREAQELDPAHAKSMFRLAYMLDLDGNEDEAVELYEQIRRLKPTYTNALLNLGVLYEDRGEYTKAVELYQEILGIFPNHARARQFLGDARASLNMYYDEDLERTEDRRAQILRIPITDFELSVRSRNCLAKMQIETLGDLIKKTEQELLSYKNFGETSLQEIKDILAQKGLRLGMGREEQRASVQAAARTLLGIEPEKGDVHGKPIEDLELSVRSRNAMAVLGVETLGDLARLSEKDLTQVKNFGQTSMNEVKEKLAEFGLSLSESEA